MAELFRRAARMLARDAGLGEIVLLAQNEPGYPNLMHLASRAWLEVDAGRRAACLDRPARAGPRGGLIALTGGPAGPLDRAFRAGAEAAARARLAVLAPLFPKRFYVELQRHGLESEREVEPRLIDLAYRGKAAAGRDQRALFRRAFGLRGA